MIAAATTCDSASTIFVPARGCTAAKGARNDNAVRTTVVTTKVQGGVLREAGQRDGEHDAEGGPQEGRHGEPAEGNRLGLARSDRAGIERDARQIGDPGEELGRDGTEQSGDRAARASAPAFEDRGRADVPGEVAVGYMTCPPSGRCGVSLT